MDVWKKEPHAQDNVEVLLIDSSVVPYSSDQRHNSNSVREPPIKCFKKRKACRVQANGEGNINYNTEKMTLKCTVCGKRFKWPSHLKHHMRSHTNERPYKCPVCPKSFKDAHKLARHQQIHPEFKKDMVYWKLYKCRVCDKQFKYPSDLDKHNLIHTDAKPFKCPTCGAGFRRFDHLKRHNFVHTGDRPFKCGVCDKGFVEATELLKHERIHTGDKPYQCTLCDKSFYHLRSLKEHAAAKHALVGLEKKIVFREDFGYKITAAKDKCRSSARRASSKTAKDRLELEKSVSADSNPNEIVVYLSDDESDPD
ncbi:uncharacterized protein RCH25_004577 [Pelodytes ibericus]